MRMLAVSLLFAVCPAAVAADAWTVTTPGKAGTGGLVPTLLGQGSGNPGSFQSLTLADALPGSTATWVLGLSELAAPFKGGILGPSPDVLLAGLPVNGAGELPIGFVIPVDFPVGLELWHQFWIQDPGASVGLSASNSVKLELQQQASIFAGRRYALTLGSGANRIGRAMTLADMNGDGLLDVVAAFDGIGAGAGGASVLLGLGGGEFGTALPFAVGFTPTGLAVGHLDGDRFLDVVVSHTDSVDIAVLLGQGDGTFGPMTSVSAGEWFNDVILADVDEDGHADLLTCSPVTDDVKVLLGAGDGSFGPPTSFPVGDQPVHLEAGDLDGDGHVDLVVALDLDDGVAALLGAGDGTFGAPMVLSTDDGPTSLALGDLDEDGTLDLVVTHGSAFGFSGSVAVALGLGTGQFTSPTIFSAGTNLLDVALVDADGDGSLDLHVAHDVSGDVWHWTGQGDGTFGSPVARPGGGAAVALADLDGDGLADTVTVSGFPADATVTLAAPASTSASYVNSGYSPFQKGPLFHDIDGDGVKDVLVPDDAANQVIVRQGLSGGSFGTSRPVSIDRPRRLAAADLDADGLADLAVSVHAASGSGIRLYFGTGTNALFGGVVVPVATGNDMEDVALADVDGDGDIDLLALEDVFAFGDGAVYVAANHGDGTFAAPSVFGLDEDPQTIELADLDLDGDLDLLVVNRVTGNLSRLLGDGAGQFAASTPVISFLTLPGALAVGDLNGDGVPDAVVSEESPGFPTLRSVLGTGSGTFTSAQSISLAKASTDLAVGDMDGDGVADLVSNESGAVIRFGVGDGTVHAAGDLRYHAGEGPQFLTLEDLDGDGALDLGASNSGDVFVVLLNQR